MKAIQVSQYGSPEVLKVVELPIPEYQNNEVLIKVHASGINPIDWKVREGVYKEVMRFDMPFIPGWDIAGTIQSVGKDVSIFKPGDEVYGMLNFPKLGSGYSEFVVANPQHIWHKPQSFSMLEAAATPLAALTAWQVLFDLAKLMEKQSVLIHAGAGGVGHMAIQFAKQKGAQVFTTCSQGNVCVVKKLGADVIIDYRHEPFENKAHDLDVVIDTVGGDTLSRSITCLKPDATLITIAAQLTPEIEQLAQKHKVHVLKHLVHPDQDQLKMITHLANDRLFNVNVTETIHYKQIIEAHKKIEGRHTQGKMVLTFS